MSPARRLCVFVKCGPEKSIEFEVMTPNKGACSNEVRTNTTFLRDHCVCESVVIV